MALGAACCGRTHGTGCSMLWTDAWHWVRRTRWLHAGCPGASRGCASRGSGEERAHRFCFWASFEDFSAPVGERLFLDVLPVGLHRVSHGGRNAPPELVTSLRGMEGRGGYEAAQWITTLAPEERRRLISYLLNYSVMKVSLHDRFCCSVGGRERTCGGGRCKQTPCTRTHAQDNHQSLPPPRRKQTLPNPARIHRPYLCKMNCLDFEEQQRSYAYCFDRDGRRQCAHVSLGQPPMNIINLNASHSCVYCRQLCDLSAAARAVAGYFSVVPACYRVYIPLKLLLSLLC